MGPIASPRCALVETVEQYAARMAKAGGGELRRILYREAGKVAMRATREGKLLARTRMRVRSGRLMGSIRSEVRSVFDVIEVRLMAGGSSAGGHVRYARIQERGGIARVPTGPTTRAGVQRSATGPGVRRGIRPKWYLRDAMRAAAKKMPTEVRRAFHLAVVGV